jgi:hypothetical protein
MALLPSRGYGRDFRVVDGCKLLILKVPVHLFFLLHLEEEKSIDMDVWYFNHTFLKEENSLVSRCLVDVWTISG